VFATALSFLAQHDQSRRSGYGNSSLELPPSTYAEWPQRWREGSNTRLPVIWTWEILCRQTANMANNARSADLSDTPMREKTSVWIWTILIEIHLSTVLHHILNVLQFKISFKVSHITELTNQ